MVVNEQNSRGHQEQIFTLPPDLRAVPVALSHFGQAGHCAFLLIKAEHFYLDLGNQVEAFDLHLKPWANKRVSQLSLELVCSELMSIDGLLELELRDHPVRLRFRKELLMNLLTQSLHHPYFWTFCYLGVSIRDGCQQWLLNLLNSLAASTYKTFDLKWTIVADYGCFAAFQAS